MLPIKFSFPLTHHEITVILFCVEALSKCELFAESELPMVEGIIESITRNMHSGSLTETDGLWIAFSLECALKSIDGEYYLPEDLLSHITSCESSIRQLHDRFSFLLER